MKKPIRGSRPEESYQKATAKNLHLDKPMSIGGWPEGEYDPPVNVRLTKWYKEMGLMEEEKSLEDLRTFIKLVLQ